MRYKHALPNGRKAIINTTQESLYNTLEFLLVDIIYIF